MKMIRSWDLWLFLNLEYRLFKSKLLISKYFQDLISLRLINKKDERKNEKIKAYKNSSLVPFLKKYIKKMLVINGISKKFSLL